MVKTGFAQVNLNEDIDFIMGGMFVEFKSEKVHTPLFASAWALEDENTKMIWVSCDVIGIDGEKADIIKHRVEKETGVPASNINVSATHTHSGPNIVIKSIYNEDRDESFLDEMYKRIIDACSMAWNKRSKAYMGYGSGEVIKGCYNRRYMMEDGTSQMHPGGRDYPGRLFKEGPEDRELQVVWFEDDDGLKGVIVNYTSHPSTLYAQKMISADYPGVMRRVILQTYGDIPVLFLQGCCGNTSAQNHEEDPGWWGSMLEGAERVGIMLGGEAVKIIASVRPERKYIESFEFANDTARLNYLDIDDEQIKESERIANDFTKVTKDKVTRIAIDKEKYNISLAMANKIHILKQKREKSLYYDAPITVLSIGDVVFVTNPAELFVEYQLSMKEKIKSSHVIAAEITNGICLYVPTKHGFLFKGYEVEQGWFDWNAGQTIEDTSVKLANSLLGKQT